MVSEALKAALRQGARQDQFLDVVERDEAERRFRRYLTLAPLGEEKVTLAQALGRILARDIVAGLDVPGFDRSNVDGFAVRAADSVGASPNTPKTLRLNSELADTRGPARANGSRRDGDDHRDGGRAAARCRCCGHGRTHPISRSGRHNGRRSESSGDTRPVNRDSRR